MFPNNIQFDYTSDSLGYYPVQLKFFSKLDKRKTTVKLTKHA